MLGCFPEKKQIPFWLITLSVIIGLTLPVLIQDGMFMDALLYSSVSHNLSIQIGHFWFPQFSKLNVGNLSSFHEHPPLVFGIQSIFFKVFGESMYVERLYTLVTTTITSILICVLWSEIHKENEHLKKLNWLPLLLWISIPVCFWSYSNNMHENTMGIFTLSAVLVILKKNKSEKKHALSWLFAGVLIFLATLSKGIPGFFPICIPLIYWLLYRKTSFFTNFSITMFLLFIPVFIYIVLFQFPDARESLSTYFFKRALFRINEEPNVGSRFYILFRLFSELIPQILIVLIFFFIAKIKKINIDSFTYKQSIFFLIVGLSASVPLMLTLVQKGFYLVPSLPYFAIGLSILIAPIVSNFINTIEIKNKKFRIFLASSMVIFILTNSLVLLQKGKAGRDKEKLNDIYIISKVVPRYSNVSVKRKLWDDWSLQGYFMRYANISLDPDESNKFFLTEKPDQVDSSLHYKMVELKTEKYNLYKKCESRVEINIIP